MAFELIPKLWAEGRSPLAPLLPLPLRYIVYVSTKSIGCTLSCYWAHVFVTRAVTDKSRRTKSRNFFPLHTSTIWLGLLIKTKSSFCRGYAETVNTYLYIDRQTCVIFIPHFSLLVVRRQKMSRIRLPRHFLRLFNLPPCLFCRQ